MQILSCTPRPKPYILTHILNTSGGIVGLSSYILPGYLSVLAPVESASYWLLLLQQCPGKCMYQYLEGEMPGLGDGGGGPGIPVCYMRLQLLLSNPSAGFASWPS